MSYRDESTPLLGQDATVSASSASTIAGLFLAALLTGVDRTTLRPNTYVGSEFNLVEYAFVFLIIHEILHAFVQPTYASLSDIYGRKLLILAALEIFAFGSAICGFSSSFMMAISGRLVSSVGVCGIAVLVTFALAHMVPLRTFALLQSAHYLCETVGSIVGATIGSQIMKGNQRLPYRINACLILLPLIWVSLAMSAPAPAPITTTVSDDSETTTTTTATVPVSPLTPRPSFDVFGAITLMTAATSIFLAIELSDSKWGASISQLMLLYAFTVSSIATFIYVETRSSSPKLVPLRSMKTSILRNSVLGYSPVMFLYTASIYQASFYLQVVRYDDTAESNLGLSPLYVGFGVGYVCGGAYIRATGNAREVIQSSTILAAVCYGLLASGLADVGQRSDQILFVLLGTAIAISFEGLTVCLISQSERSENASLISMNNAFWSIFGAFGRKIAAALFKYTMAQILRLKLQDVGLSHEIMSKLFQNLDELRSFSPEIRQVVVTSVRQISQILHIPICALAVVAALAALGLRPRVR